jgi:uncharacterized protein
MPDVASVTSVKAPESYRLVSASAIDDVVRQIAQRFRPRRIILFGSYAYGEPRPGSDVDMLVEMDTPLKEVQQAVCICQEIEYHFGLDLIVRTPAVVAARVAMGDPFLREAIGRGRVLYDATRR